MEVIKELERLLALASNVDVRKAIQAEINSRSVAAAAIPAIPKPIVPEPEKKVEEKKPVVKASPPKKSTGNRFVKVKSYAWEENKTKLKFRISGIPDLAATDTGKVDVTIHAHKVKIVISQKGLDHTLMAEDLHGELDTTKKAILKIKPNSYVLVTLTKATEGVWETLTQTDAKKLKEREARDKAMGGGGDSGGGQKNALMNMMQKMYDDGDDSTKRMINESWGKVASRDPNDPLPSRAELRSQAAAEKKN